MDPTVLQVQCGSCNNTVNVPSSLLDQLLAARQFNCPHCRSSQQVQLSEKMVGALQRQHTPGAGSSRRRALTSPTRLNGNCAGDAAGSSCQEAYRALGNGSENSNWRGSALSGMDAINACKRKFYEQRAAFGSSAKRMYAGGGATLATGLHQQLQDAAASEDGGEDEGMAEDDPASTFMVGVISRTKLADGGLYQMGKEYKPWKLPYGMAHPDPVVETASLASVEPPDIHYQLHLDDLVASGGLSALQLESIVYACQRHQTLLPDDQRAGFFIGDGAGVGKGRTIAGLILENWRCGRRKHLWLSIGSDLRFDSRRDLDDVGAAEIGVHPLNKLPYGSLDSRVPDGVIFLTYSSLISSSDKGSSRLQQLVEWCGPEFDGLIVFDECHKAKNLVPDSGGRATKVGEKVLQLQRMLPSARIVYCSATGASEARNLGYMERLGLWGPGNAAFPDFPSFLVAVGARGVAALELVAMDLKAQGVYVARTLSFAGAEFEVREEALDGRLAGQYGDAAIMWCQLRREFLYAAEQLDEALEAASGTAGFGPNEGGAASGGGAGKTKGRHLLWRAFWGAHQRFFRHMCMASKVPALVRLAKEAVDSGRCCVIGLQSTGEARTADVVAERGEELDDFVSGPKELLLKLVEDHYPLPPDPDADPAAEAAASAARGRGKRGAAAGRAPRGKAAKAAAAASKAEAEEDGLRAGTCADGSCGGIMLQQQQQQPPHLQNSLAGAGPDAATLTAAQAELRAIEKEHATMRYSGAKARKDQVLRAVAAMELPNNPLDSLIDQLGGTAAVAEMTGRKGRLVRRTDKPGVRWEARNASGCAANATLDMINVHERTLFLAGSKLIAVISEAASAGISLHADKRAENTRRRVHLTLELPWSADKAIQQFGRSHRANQVHAPQYRLLFTPLGGERRFAAAVARRLQSLGALTQGDRRAGPSLHEYNYESTWGQRALKATYRAILEEESPPVPPPACCPRPGGGPAEMTQGVFYGRARAHLLNVGIIRPAPHVTAIDINAFLSDEAGAPINCGKISDQDKGDVPRFLNRLLGLEPAAQAHVFELFQAVLEAIVDAARRDGSYDDGIVDVAATSITLASQPRIVRTDPTSGAKTLLFEVDVDRGISWLQAQDLLVESSALCSQPAPASVVAADSSAADGIPDSITAQQAANGVAPPQLTATASAAASAYDGFYRARQEGVGGRTHCMLAVCIQNSGPPIFRIHRPATGRSPKLMKLDELANRYVRLAGEVAQRLWEGAYAEAGRNKGSGAGARRRRVNLLAGLVLPVWHAVQDALAQLPRALDRKLSVLRLQTTGKDAMRLVGVAIPDAALPAVLERLGAPPAVIDISADEPPAAVYHQQQQQQHQEQQLHLQTTQQYQLSQLANPGSVWRQWQQPPLHLHQRQPSFEPHEVIDIA